MQRRARAPLRISQGAVIATWLFVLSALLILRANWNELKGDLAGSFRLYVALKPATPDTAAQAALLEIQSLAGISSVELRDPKADEQAFFAQEPWASEFKDALQTHFLPAVVQVTLKNPFLSEDTPQIFIERIQEIEAVDTVLFSKESHSLMVRAARVFDHIFMGALVAVAILVFIIAGAIEWLRHATEIAPGFEPQTFFRWGLDRFLTALFGSIFGVGAAVAAALFLSRRFSLDLAILNSADVVLLSTAGIVPFFAWALVFRAARPGLPDRSAQRPS